MLLSATIILDKNGKMPLQKKLEAPQRSVKTKIYVIFLSSSGVREGLTHVSLT